MKYFVLYKIDNLSKDILLKSYLKEDYKIVLDIDNIILIKKSNKKIIDEDIYIKVLYSNLKRSELLKNNNGKIIDFTEAFKYASIKEGYNKFDNKFEWFIKNIIIKETINY